MQNDFLDRLNDAIANKDTVALILAEMDHRQRIAEYIGIPRYSEITESLERVFAKFENSTLYKNAFLVLLTGEAANRAAEVAEEIRAEVEALKIPLDESQHVTMHFGVTRASSDWRGIESLILFAEDAIKLGQERLGANRVFVESHITVLVESHTML